MSIAVRCSQCAQGFSAPDKLAGKRVKCPKCGAAVAIPPPVVEEPEIDLLDDKLSIPSSIDAFAPAAPVTLRSSPTVEPKPAVQTSRPSQLKRHAPALELVGAVVFGCGLFGLFAFFALHYTSTWRDLGVVFMLGGGVLFGLAQMLDFDGERLGRAFGVLFFFCVISASIGGGIEVASGRMKASSLKFWGTSDPDELYQESNELVENLYSVLLQIRNLESANQHADELLAADANYGEWMARNKDKKVYMSRKKKEELINKKNAAEHLRESKFGNVIITILQSPRASDTLRVIRQNAPNLLKYEPGATEAFDSLINRATLAEQQGKSFNSATSSFAAPQQPVVPPPAAPAPTLTQPPSARSPIQPPSSHTQSALASAEQRRKEVEARHKEMADRMAKQIEATRNRLSSGATSTAASRPAPKSSNPFSTFTGSSSNAGKEKISLHGRGLRESAESEFDWHRDAAGQVLLQAAALAGSDEALKPQLQWSPALKRPAFSLYWGIGVSQEPMADAPAIDDRWKNVRRSLEARRRDPSWQQVDEFKKRTGDVGAGLAEGLQQRINHREFGDWGAESNRSSRELRGLVLLEPGTLGWAVQEAHGLGLDVLAIFHLQDKKSAAGPYTEMQINIVRASDGRSLWHSEVLSDRKLRNARKKGDDPAADLVASAFAFIDKELRLTKMPVVKPEVAKKRAEKLADDPLIEPIAAIFEIRYYQVQGLLTDDEAQALYEKKVGAEVAEALATGDEDERKQAITSYFSK